ncbi:MAG: MATE family efflux transporter [Desulfobulbus sp.]|nr:MATE family efflux transporter [Desulfobulbus sp.]
MLLRLTGPLLLAQLSQTAMGFVDTVMAGRYSAIDLAAVAVGSSIFFPVYLFLIGLQNAVTPLVAQAHGRGDRDAIRGSIRLGMVVGLVAGLLLMPVLWWMEPLMVWLGVSVEVIPITSRYLFAVSWGLPLGGVFYGLKGGGDGLGRTRLSMFAGFLGLGVNILANYLLIYGKLGLPVLGGVGCGWATSISILAMMTAMAWLLYRSKLGGTEQLFVPTTRVTTTGPGGIGSFLRLGLPLGVTMFIECSIFTVIALFIAKLGAQVVAAHQIALNFTSMLYMLPYSLATALTVRVGFTIGRGRVQRLPRLVATGLGLALSGSVLTCLGILIFSREIAALYTPDPMIQTLAVALLIYAAIFQMPDAMQVNASGILRGCKDTRVPLVLMLVAYWGIGLPLGYGLGLAGLGGMEPGPQGFWIGLICALTTAALLMWSRVVVVIKRLQRRV